MAKLHPNEKAFREKAKSDPERAAHLKKFPHPVKLKHEKKPKK